jgi:hypothetical protein
MTEKNDPAVHWHPLEIKLRTDLYQKALERGLDISDLCNRALEEALSHDHQKGREPGPSSSVIVARNGGTARLSVVVPVPAVKALHPVINADDPSASSKVKQAKQHQTARVQPETAPVQPSEGTIGKPPVAAIPKKGPAARKDKKATGKKSRHELLKMFFASEVAREDAPGAGVSKDVMYETFARWCREKRILPVPDRRSLTVALKNQFALQETVIEGVPSWTGIRLK